MFSNYYNTPKLSSYLTSTQTSENVLVYPTSEGTGIIDFTLELTLDGNGSMVSHIVELNSITQVNNSIERVMVKNVRRDQSILLIIDARSASRISKMMDGRLLSSQTIVNVNPRGHWFNQENNKLAALLGDLSNSGTSPLDELLENEYPCRIDPIEKQKIRAYLKEKGVRWKALVALANSLPFYIRQIKGSGVNDVILSKRFYY